jgi:tricorn protease
MLEYRHKDRIRQGRRPFAIFSGLAAILLLSSPARTENENLLLLRTPSLSKTQIAFAYAGNIWVVGREGGQAIRLTTGGHESGPFFSPDGSQIAFTGQYDGNVDVFVIPATGGVPRRLTYHPAPDVGMAWTPDGKRILFRSNRSSATDPTKFFTVSVDGGFPTEILLPMADQGVFSPDGTRLAYVPNFQWQAAWKRYRGGQTKRIWVVNLSDSSLEQKIPQENNSNDFNPLWVGNKIYFLSDRNGPVSLFAYDLGTKKVTEVIKNDGLDLKSAAAGSGAIVYEQFGSLHLLDLKSKKDQTVHVEVAGDFREVRPHFEKLTPQRILSANISPTGQRAVFEVHGEIVTVPAEKGDIRNLTNSPTVADRDPAWSPDGKSIAFFSDESGEYALHIVNQNGLGPVKKIDLGQPPSFFYSPTWSPDSKMIAYEDKRLNLWYVELDKGTPVKVDTNLYEEGPSFNQAWAPDSRWLTYTKVLPNKLHAVFVYSLETAKSVQITDGMSDAQFPDFDKGGKYLYFTASTDLGLGGEDGMTRLDRPVTRHVYAVVLKKELPSPVAPESDEEKPEEKKPEGAAAAKEGAKGEEKAKPKEAPKTEIDFDRISQRIVALPIPAENYLGLTAGKEGELYLAQGPRVFPLGGPVTATLQKFVLKTRKTNKLLDGVRGFALSANGEKILYRVGDVWFIAKTAAPPKPGEGALKLADMEVFVDPRAEWRQIYHEVWRIERDFFYDPGHHGLDLAAAEKFYAPYLDDIVTRDDLNYLFVEMLGNMTVGHMFVGGGEAPEPKRIKTGLLGADYKIENGRYRFARVYDGENWNPELLAPLTQPGVNVTAGEYLLAVNGRELHAADEIYSFFEETAGKQVVLKVGPNPDGSGSREVTVVPVDSEFNLRHLAWVEGNRRKVDEETGGRVAYVQLPDTSVGGFTNFNRYFFAQVDKQAAIIDERFNHGGFLADYIVENLRRPVLNRVTTREGEDMTLPAEEINGPKVMVINQFAGSGGDALPWFFRRLGLGPLVGMKTWGGLVGIGGYPQLIDGGFVMAPRIAIYGLTGKWEVENHGIAPDYEVEMDPKLVREGHDPQLEKAVEVVLELLKKNPRPTYPRPPYVNYHQHFPASH